MADVIIRGGTVVDGLGNAPVVADVAIRAGRIVEIGPIAPIEEASVDVLPAAGRLVCPGFIDTHVHVDALLLRDPDYAPGLRQGVTSVIVGNDGLGLAPSTAQTLPAIRQMWAGILGDHDPSRAAFTIGEYLAAMDGSVAPNVGTLMPHGPLRMETMGLAARPASRREIAQMARQSAIAYGEGALGFSIGLDYVPCLSATSEEFEALARVAADWGGPFVTHMRNYVGGAADAVREALAVGAAAGSGVHISHFNVSTDGVLPLVDEARAHGRDVTFDLYPYLAGAPSLTFFLPGWAQEGGMDATLARLRKAATRTRLGPHVEAMDAAWGWDRVVLTDIGGATAYQRHVGRSVRAAAEALDRPIVDLVADILLESNGAAATVTHHRHRTEDNQARLIEHPAHIGASDGVYVGRLPHPRGSGTFARYAAMAARGGASRLPEAIRHLTAAAADRFGLTDRGRLIAGAAADIVVLDRARIQDRATYESPTAHPEGVDHVLVNGVPVIRNGAPTGARPGRALRRT